ncbi:hypothetical protein Fcan01_24077 [Folsomia candida]|uniref:Ionotropic glutamate receptor C-terminal domain-containing protein n=1 Tax=Folsomia candida TaxID=158441 RepID=A0A226DAD2_FOLCA|nr:hypothetical protein Fcan01_24077 [Folsomia candida]
MNHKIFDGCIFMISKMQLLGYATRYFEFTLVLYTGQRGSLDFVKLLEPLDTLIWIGLTIGFLVTFVSIICLAEKREKIGGVLFKVFSVMLDQSQHAAEGDNVLPNKVTILITTWTLTLSIISTCYKGDLLSYFVMDNPPTTPDTIEGLDRSGIMITTNTFYKVYEVVYSILKEDVLPDLSRGEDPLAQFYKRLNPSTILLTGKVESLVANFSRNKPVASDRGLIQIPDTFATLDDKRVSEWMKFLAETLTMSFNRRKWLEGLIPC